MSLRELIARRRIHSDVDLTIKQNRCLDTQVGYTEKGDPTFKINLPGICKEPGSVILRDLLSHWGGGSTHRPTSADIKAGRIHVVGKTARRILIGFENKG